jgi:pimeloyl-ACP methyl ester carboxylesterase
LDHSAFILVHGTWAPRATWIDPASVISRRLSTAFPTADHYAFRWSGGNSHDARIQAGAELARTVTSIHRECGTTQFFLIGHSHGGNVVLYALAVPEVAALVPRAAFLATPFIEIDAIDVETWTSRLEAIIHQFQRYVFMLGAPVLITGGWPVIAAYGLFLAMIFSARDRLVGWTTDILHEKQRVFIANAETADPGIPIFVATEEGDEALRHLTVIDFLSQDMWRGDGVAGFGGGGGPRCSHPRPAPPQYKKKKKT